MIISKNTDKIKTAGTYLASSYVITDLLVSQFDNLEGQEAGVLALVNVVLVIGKMILEKYLNKTAK